ncbi:MAG: FkbM family methyltransferase [Promethearchaeota archaeon]
MLIGDLSRMKKYNLRDIMRYVFYKFKLPQLKMSWKGDYINISVNGVRFKYPTGIHNIERKNILSHVWNFEFPNVNLFVIDLVGYFEEYSPKEGDVIIDIGAFSGIFSIYCAMKMKNTGKIIAFEPNSESLELFRKAIRINNLTNIEIVEKGVWDKKDSLNFLDKGVCSEIVSGKGDYVVPVIDLDTQLKKMRVDFKTISFIKMDIEGAEIEALEGMRAVLTNGSPKLAIASYHLRDGKKTCFFVEKFLKKFGYKTKTSYPKHLTTYGVKVK